MPGTILGSGDMRGMETEPLASCRLSLGVISRNKGD